MLLVLAGGQGQALTVSLLDFIIASLLPLGVRPNKETANNILLISSKMILISSGRGKNGPLETTLAQAPRSLPRPEDAIHARGNRPGPRRPPRPEEADPGRPPKPTKAAQPRKGHSGSQRPPRPTKKPPSPEETAQARRNHPGVPETRVGGEGCGAPEVTQAS